MLLPYSLCISDIIVRVARPFKILSESEKLPFILYSLKGYGVNVSFFKPIPSVGLKKEGRKLGRVIYINKTI